MRAVIWSRMESEAKRTAPQTLVFWACRMRGREGSFLPLREEGSWEGSVGGHFVAGPVLDAGEATVTKHRPVLPELLS